jgi:hypothetical protein
VVPQSRRTDINVNHIIIASVNAVLTVFAKLERHLFILLGIAAIVKKERTYTHECQISKFMILSHINPMSCTKSSKDKKTVFFTTFVQQMHNIC